MLFELPLHKARAGQAKLRTGPRAGINPAPTLTPSPPSLRAKRGVLALKLRAGSGRNLSAFSHYRKQDFSLPPWSRLPPSLKLWQDKSADKSALEMTQTRAGINPAPTFLSLRHDPVLQRILWVLPNQTPQTKCLASVWSVVVHSLRIVFERLFVRAFLLEALQVSSISLRRVLYDKRGVALRASPGHWFVPDGK